MADATVHHEAMDTKWVTAWQSTEESCQQRMSVMPRVAETANPCLLVMNLQRVMVGSMRAAMQGLSAEDVKKQKGTRATFMIVKVLCPGWTWVGGGDKENKKGAKKVPPEAKEKLGRMVGEHVVLHSYELVNTRGVYGKGARSTECLGLSPGMVLSMMVWGQSFEKVFKEETADVLEPFDLCMVQIGSKSMQSVSVETGQMLELKAMCKSQQKGLSVGSLCVFGGNVMASSLQESAVRRSQHLEGALLPPEVNQGLIKGNVSTTVNVVLLEACKGTFAMSADDELYFHTAQPLADLMVSRIHVHHDMEGDKDWVTKLFNVLCLAGCMELVVILDSYKMDDKEEVIMEGFARANMAKMLERLGDKVDASCVQATLGANKHVTVHNVGGILLAVDTRKMTKKGDTVVPRSSLVHAQTAWEKGYGVHFFYDERLVHCGVIPVVPDFMGAEGSKQVLNTVTSMKWGEEVEFEGETVKPKRKRAEEH